MTTGFDKYILVPLLEEFVDYYDSYSLTTSNLPMKLIDVRLGFLFGYTMVLGNQRNDKLFVSEDLDEQFKKMHNLSLYLRLSPEQDP